MTAEPTDGLQAVGKLVLQLVAAGVADDREAAIGAFEAIADFGDQHNQDEGLWFGVSCALAETVKRTDLTGDKPGTWGIEVTDTRTNEIVNPDALPDRGIVAATRFLVAYANGDKAMCFSMFRALTDGGDMETAMDFLIALWRISGESTRAALEDGRGLGDGSDA